MNNLHKQVRDSVWCSANLYNFHLKGSVFSFVKKSKQTSILERQMADRVKLSLLSKITLWWKWRLPWKSGSRAICRIPMRGHGGHLADKVIHISKHFCIFLFLFGDKKSETVIWFYVFYGQTKKTKMLIPLYIPAQ